MWCEAVQVVDHRGWQSFEQLIRKGPAPNVRSDERPGHRPDRVGVPGKLDGDADDLDGVVGRSQERIEGGRQALGNEGAGVTIFEVALRVELEALMERRDLASQRHVARAPW